MPKITNKKSKITNYSQETHFNKFDISSTQTTNDIYCIDKNQIKFKTQKKKYVIRDVISWHQVTDDSDEAFNDENSEKKNDSKQLINDQKQKEENQFDFQQVWDKLNYKVNPLLLKSWNNHSD